MKTYTVTFTEDQAEAVGFALGQALETHRAKLRECPDDPWRSGLVRHLDAARVALDTAPVTESMPPQSESVGFSSARWCDELGPMHDSSEDGCHPDCAACARESRFRQACGFASDRIAAGDPREAVEHLANAIRNAPNIAARKALQKAQEEAQIGNPENAALVLAEVMEAAGV